MQTRQNKEIARAIRAAIIAADFVTLDDWVKHLRDYEEIHKLVSELNDELGTIGVTAQWEGNGLGALKLTRVDGGQSGLGNPYLIVSTERNIKAKAGYSHSNKGDHSVKTVLEEIANQYRQG